MSFYNNELIDKLKKKIKDLHKQSKLDRKINWETMSFYPDVLPYRHTPEEYDAHLKAIAGSQYIYANGLEIRPISFGGYLWQSFKGWLGFTNYCQPETVQYTLKKLTYFGYLNGYPQTPLDQMRNSDYQLADNFKQLIVTPRTTNVSQTIQQDLVSYYDQNPTLLGADSFQASWSSTSTFGKTWREMAIWEPLPVLDPQDPELIQEGITELAKIYIGETTYNFISSSEYAKQAARFYLNKAKNAKPENVVSTFLDSMITPTHQTWKPNLLKALKFDAAIYKDDLKIYIDLALQSKDYGNAVNLITELTQDAEARDYLIKNLNFEQLRQFVTKDSRLGVILAKHYLGQTGSLFASSEESIRKAVLFCSDLEPFNPVFAFNYQVMENNFDQAYQIFERNKDNNLPFHETYRKQLAKHFSSNADKKAVEADKIISGDFATEDALLLEILETRRKALNLVKNSTYTEMLEKAKFNYAKFLIAFETDGNSIQPEILNKALNILDNCKLQPKDEPLKLKAQVTALIRQADALIEKIKTADYVNSEILKQHTTEHQSDFATISRLLFTVIKLLKGTDQAYFKPILGKAHFMLADMILYFDVAIINDEGKKVNYKNHFEAAKNAVPTNPFYQYMLGKCYSKKQAESYNDTKNAALYGEKANECYHNTEKQIKNLKLDMRDISSLWHETRWCKEKKDYVTIADIHSLKLKPSAAAKPQIRVTSS